MSEIEPLNLSSNVRHAYHLYVVQFNLNQLQADRGEIFKFFREKNILVNVHYLPVHLQPFYREKFDTQEGLCPIADKAYERILSLPIYPTVTEQQISYVIETMKQAVERFRLKKHKSARRNFSYSS